jgi:hypothetical protein
MLYTNRDNGVHTCGSALSARYATLEPEIGEKIKSASFTLADLISFFWPAQQRRLALARPSLLDDPVRLAGPFRLEVQARQEALAHPSGPQSNLRA